jgi:hypothetical protein
MFQSCNKKSKTYNSGYSLVVTHLTTNPPVSCLSTAERTGSSVLKILWSYVKERVPWWSCIEIRNELEREGQPICPHIREVKLKSSQYPTRLNRYDMCSSFLVEHGSRVVFAVKLQCIRRPCVLEVELTSGHGNPGWKRNEVHIVAAEIPSPPRA